jgi:hypothetical protein
VNAAELIQTVTRLGGRVTLEAGKLKARVPADRPDLLETLKANRDAVLEHLANMGTKRPEPRDTGTTAQNLPGSLGRLPFELEALIRAATNDSLPKSATLEAGIIPDLNRYVLAWGCVAHWNAQDALPRLWAVHPVWLAHLSRLLN